MALAQTPTLTVNIEYIDITGSRGSSKTHLPTTKTLADAITSVDALVVDLVAATDCHVTGYSITASKIDTATPAPAANSRVEERARMFFRTVVGKIAEFSFPAPKAAIVATSGGLITTNALVTAVISALSGGGFTDSNGQALSAIVKDEQTFKRTTRKQATTDTAPNT